MANDHRPTIPTTIEHLVNAMSELETVLGEAGRQVIPIIQTRLAEAMAARDRGDPIGTMKAIGAAMHQLAALAGRLDPQEAAMMQAVAEHFGTALLRGDVAEAKQGMDVMFARSGARERKKT